MKLSSFILLLFLGISFSVQAQKSKFKLSISVKSDSTEADEKQEEPRSLFGKMLNTIRAVKEVIGDPSKLNVSLQDNKGSKESLKDYLKRKGPLKSRESYLPMLPDELLAYRQKESHEPNVVASVMVCYVT